MDRDNIPELYAIWDEARSYIESGNYDKAIEIYRYILVRFGDNDVAAEHVNAYLGDSFGTFANGKEIRRSNCLILHLLSNTLEQVKHLYRIRLAAHRNLLKGLPPG